MENAPAREKLKAALRSLERALKSLREAANGNSVERMQRIADIEIVRATAKVSEVKESLDSEST